MSRLETWFNSAKNVTKVFKDNGGSFLIYKGFKIREEGNHLSLLDVRFRDIYSEVSSKDFSIMEEYGFIVGVDIIGYDRDCHKVLLYNKKVMMYYDLRDSLDKTKSDYNTRLRNCNKNINKNIDLFFYHKTKINQFNIKYSKVISIPFRDKILDINADLLQKLTRLR